MIPYYWILVSYNSPHKAMGKEKAQVNDKQRSQINFLVYLQKYEGYSESNMQ
jgi:hypothetical protein